MDGRDRGARRLSDATADQRQNFRLIGGGQGVHWPEAAEREEDRGLLSRAVSAVRGWFGGEDDDEPAEEPDPPDTDELSQPPSGVDREGRLRYYLGADPVPRAGAEPGSVDGGAS